MIYITYAMVIISVIYTVAKLLYNFVKVIHRALKSRNWMPVVQLVTNLMEKAEQLFSEGAAKKQWVLDMVAQYSKDTHMPVDMQEIGNLIDELAKMAHHVNIKG